MEERIRVLAWVLAGGGSLGVLGGAFGALTGVVTWRNGRAAGTGLGLAVARAFARAAEAELSPGVRGALVGATDGFVFLGLVGTALGAFVASREPRPWEVLSPAVLTAALLAAGAVAFGVLGAAIHRAGVWGVLGVFAGGISGAGAGAYLGGLDGLLIGTMAGVLAGTAAALAGRGAGNR